MAEKYYDLKRFPIHSDYWNDEKYQHKPTFNRYIGIRLATSFDELCDETNPENIGLLDKETKSIQYTWKHWMKTKPTSSTYDCEKLFIENIPPDIILIPNEYCIKHAESKIDSIQHCEKIFLSETKIKEYEHKYLQMYDDVVLRYSKHIEQLKKYDENIYRFIMVVDNNTDIILKPESELDEKIKYIYNQMVSNDYVSAEVEINSVIKNSNEFDEFDGVDFIGKIKSYNRKITNNNLNTGFGLDDDITLSSDVFTKLLSGNPDDINISQSNIYFEDAEFTIILIKESLYKERFLEWIYDYLN